MSAIQYAFKYTISGHIIIEEFLEKKGFNLSILDKIFYQNAMNFFKNAFDITV